MATRKTIASNRQAYHHYEIIAEYEAGIVLFGYEVKALRCFHASLNQAYISVHHGAPWLKNVIIKPFTGHHCFHAAPDRSRKLLLHQHELERIFLRQQQQRLFLVPLAMYWKQHLVKIKIGLGKSKNLYDKRLLLKQKQAQHQIQFEE